VAGELRRVPGEHKPVHGGEEAQRQRRAGRLAGMRAQDLQRDAAGIDVGGRGVEQQRVQRRRGRAAHVRRLQAQALAEPGGGPIATV